MIEPIDITKIRGRWKLEKVPKSLRGIIKPPYEGDDTIKSIQLVANKLNEVIKHLNRLDTKN